MDKARWQQIQKLFDHLVDKTPSHRADYLEMVCEDDLPLRCEVERLLAANDEVTGAAWLPKPTAACDTDLPKTIDGYQISGILGKGGMGIVYQATNATGQAVALKVLPRYLLGDDHSQRRFLQEAKALSAVRHPAICRIEEYFISSEGQPCIVMEYCQGETLTAAIEKESLSLSASIALIKTLAEGLQPVHDKNIFHRDIKPSNILIDSNRPTENIKLIDFGIAKFADERLTATGIMLGSPQYMSPEQWRGEPVDQSTDLWSLGVLWFELLAGENPFSGDTPQQRGIAVLENEAKPLPDKGIDESSTNAVKPVIARLLSKAPEQRYQSCEELISALAVIHSQS